MNTLMHGPCYCEQKKLLTFHKLWQFVMIRLCYNAYKSQIDKYTSKTVTRSTILVAAPSMQRLTY